MSHVMCHYMSCCFVGLRISHSSGIHFRVRVLGLHSCLQFALTIRDMIGCGVMWGDVTINSFMFSYESHWHVTKSVTLHESF